MRLVYEKVYTTFKSALAGADEFNETTRRNFERVWREDYRQTQDGIRLRIFEMSEHLKRSNRVWRQRECHGCKKPLSWRDCVRTNVPSMSREALKKFWNENHLEFLCCDCYARKISEKEKKEKEMN